MLGAALKTTLLASLAFLPVMFAPALAADAKQDREDVSLWSRSKLLDSPERQELQERGVSINGWLTQTYQGLLEGDGPHSGQYGGKATITGTFDGGKLGLWDGLSANVIFEQIYGDDANSYDSALLAFKNVRLRNFVACYVGNLQVVVI